MIVYFIQKPARVRKFKIVGIYNTGLEEFDKIYSLVDIAHIQKLNGWNKNQIGGFQVFLNDISSIEKIIDYIYYNIIDLSVFKDFYWGRIYLFFCYKKFIFS